MKLADKKFWMFLGGMAVAMMLSSCASTSDIRNVESTFYAHNTSQKIIPVVFDEKEDPTPTSPTRYNFLVEKNIIHDNKLIIPKDSELSCVSYYPDNMAYFVVTHIRLVGNTTYTPAQGVVSMTSENRGVATLSFVAIPK